MRTPRPTEAEILAAIAAEEPAGSTRRNRLSEAEILAAIAAEEIELAQAGVVDVPRARAAVRGAFAALARVARPRDPRGFAELQRVWKRWCRFAKSFVVE